MKQLLRYLLLLCGSLSVALGVIGIFLPVFPTTPFMILAAFCYMKSSEKFYNWLYYHRWFGPYIQNYFKYRGIPRKAKIYSISTLWISIISTAIFVFDHFWIRFTLFFIAFLVTWYLWSLKTVEYKRNYE